MIVLTTMETLLSTMQVLKTLWAGSGKGSPVSRTVLSAGFAVEFGGSTRLTTGVP